MARLRQIAGCLEDAQRQLLMDGHVSREFADRVGRGMIKLRLASPLRADAGAMIQPQHNTDALPLFEAADQPSLF